jgi:hypothetical protein
MRAKKGVRKPEKAENQTVFAFSAARIAIPSARQGRGLLWRLYSLDMYFHLIRGVCRAISLRMPARR